MRRLGRAVASVLATGLLTGAGIAATTAAASASTNVASCSAQGQFATCAAAGIAPRPVTLTVTVTASPNQQVFVAWNTTCSVGTSSGSSKGTFTAQTPVTRTISHPWHQPDRCIFAAAAQLRAGGNSVHVSLSYSQTAPVSHEIKGYAGKCVDDNRNSSALRAKVQIWNCTNAASQQWSFSHGELKHGRLCLNDKANGGKGSPVILWTCNGSSGETWSHNAAGEYVLKANGLCLDDPAYSTRNGTQLVVYTCKKAANQRWSLP